MILLCALDPDVAKDWRALRFVLSHIGVEHSRLLLEYPVGWAAVASDVARDNGGLNYTKVVEVLRAFTRGRLVQTNPHPAYDDDRPWLSNTLSLSGRGAPQIIIVPAEVSHPSSRVVLESDLSTSNLWASKSSASIPRTASAFGQALFLLLMSCRKVTIADPHFRPEKHQWWPVLKIIADILKANPRVEEIDYHLLEADRALNWFEDKCQRHICRIIPQGKRVRFVRWSEREFEDRFHDRCVLTDIGGVSSGYGFDEDSTSTTLIQTIDQETANDILSRFDMRSSPYDYVDQLVVSGTKT